MPIDESRTFEPLGIAVLTVSDTRTLADDTSGNLLASRAADAGHDVRARAIVTDDVDSIQARLRDWIADPHIDVVLTTGGTGVTARDVTPDAVEALFDKPIPGFGELFRWISFETIGTSTIQSRATAGLAGTTYIFALPGSTGACRDAWDRILASQLDSRHRPCNFAELRHRL
ncbi:MAG: molybdenum cofactor biosynthesis protein B [Alphaproteobacteria bacterium]|nr:molybdenum cofactor biosynthesis protein B [Alphaproteobacteria bacterium]